MVREMLAKTLVKTIQVAGLLILALLFIGFLTTRDFSGDPPPPPTPEEIAAKQQQSAAEKALWKRQAALRHQASLRRQGLVWTYTTAQDEMGRGEIKMTAVRSGNQVDLDFPYAGAQRGKLRLRLHPQHGRDVIFSVERGQIVCPFGGCDIAVRFGDDKPVVYRAVGSDSGDSTTLFIERYDRFLASLRRADRVSIEVLFFGSGRRVFAFATSGLQWP